MKQASVPIWSVRLVWPLGLRESASVDAHAGLKTFHHFTVRRCLQPITDDETSWRVFASFKPNRKILEKQKKLVIAALVRDFSARFFLLHHP